MSAHISDSALHPRIDGIEHFRRSDFANALVCFEQSLSMQPDDLEIYNYKARALEKLGRLDESLACIDRCLERGPHNCEELRNRALLLTKLSRSEEALTTLDRVLQLQPNHADTLIKQAVLRHQLGRREEALTSAARAVSASPRDLAALNTRGMILDDLGRREEARTDFQAALTIDPRYAAAITNLAIVHARGGHYEQALAHYAESLAIDPHQDNAIYNRAVIRLLLGDWRQGFIEYESRWKLFPHEAARLTRLAPQWRGEGDIKGKTVLLHHEQGFGDTLQFSRYAPRVMALGARVIVATPATLARLMKTLPGSPEIVSEGDAVPKHDYHCPIMSLPLAFRTTPTTVAASVPYLRADPADVRRWSERLGPRLRPRIGLVWSGRRYPPINHARDMTFESVRPLFTLNADFFCLHTELSDAERAQLASSRNLRCLGDQLTDFAETAAVIENLDVIISVDTAIAHLAGALGKPVWLMNRYTSCWRWLLNRSDTPWYPSLRIFRQPALGDWDSVVEQVIEAGRRFLANFPERGSHAASQAPPATTGAQPQLLKTLQSALDRHHQQRLTEAIVLYQQVLNVAPDQVEALHYLGIALAQNDQHTEALKPLSRALELQPNSAAIHNHYGNALAGLGRHQEAIASYDQAIACDPEFADSHYNRGIAFLAMGKQEIALNCYSMATQLNPTHAQAFNNRALLQAEAGNVAEALQDYQQAIHAQPEFVDAWINQADLFRRFCRYSNEALECSGRAVQCNPHHALAHNCHGATLANVGRYTEAMASYDRALQLEPALAEARWNKGLVHLCRGELREGWTHYEARWQVKSLKLAQRFADRPTWQGIESINAKVILVHHEQGYGDSIHFSRYVTLLADRGARVILSAPTPLHALFNSLHGVHKLVDLSATPAFDCHCPLMSLPLALGTEMATIPAPSRYLQADPDAKKRWAARLKARHRIPTVGLVWSGKPTHAKDLERSIPVQQWLPLISDKIRWVSLQKEVRPADALHLSAMPTILRFGEELTDFADTAALIENLDLVVTVDTAVAHLAGALAKPVWILLPYVTDWRWFQDREDSPWYPTARLFRQTNPGDWTSVIACVGTEIRGLFEVKAPATKAATATAHSRARPGKKGGR